VARGVTLHGFALNCNPELRFFDNFVPCGISDAGVTSLSKELDREVTVAEVLAIVEAHLPALVDVPTPAEVGA
jgi:lipoyl(octanoyl) transferase